MSFIIVVEDPVTLKILLCDKDIVDGNFIEHLARRSVQKYGNTVRPLRYDNHSIYVRRMNAFFQSFHCPNCDTFFKKAIILERRITACGEQVNFFPRKVRHLRETLFDKLESFDNKYTMSEQKLFKSSGKLNFQSVCVQEEILKDTNTATWIGKHLLIFVSIC